MSSIASSQQSSMKFLDEFNSLWGCYIQLRNLDEQLGDNPVMAQHIGYLKAEVKRRMKFVRPDIDMDK